MHVFWLKVGGSRERGLEEGGFQQKLEKGEKGSFWKKLNDRA